MIPLWWLLVQNLDNAHVKVLQEKFKLKWNVVDTVWTLFKNQCWDTTATNGLQFVGRFNHLSPLLRADSKIAHMTIHVYLIMIAMFCYTCMLEQLVK